MTRITVYNVDTGEIRQTLDLPAADIALNVGEGEAYIEAAWAPRRYYIADGQPVEFPASPGDWAVWDWATHEWTDPRDDEYYAEELAAAKSDAQAQITAKRGSAREPYITDLPGQDALYIAKRDEATEYLADPEPDMANYPLIQSEVGVTADTAYEVAQVFLNLNSIWKQASAQIDTACFTAEASVEAATDVAGVETALADLDTALEALA